MFARFKKSQLNEIPLANHTMSQHVPAVMTALVYLLCVVIAAVFAISDSLERWDVGVSNRISVEIPLHHELDRERLMPAIVSYLKTFPGVTKVEAVEQERLLDLLSPWVGQTNKLNNIPLPIIIDLDVKANADISLPDLVIGLQRFDAGVRVEAHARWLESIKTLRMALQVIAIMFAVIIALAVISIITLVTKTGLATYQEIIDTLRLIGAKNSYIAAKFQQNAFRLTSNGALKGYVLAAITVVLLGQANVIIGLPDFLQPSFSTILFVYMGIAPVFALSLSYIIARFAVLRSLKAIN